jgi:hypothetical protein
VRPRELSVKIDSFEKGYGLAVSGEDDPLEAVQANGSNWSAWTGWWLTVGLLGSTVG